jgi:hypothetical protein
VGLDSAISSEKWRKWCIQSSHNCKKEKILERKTKQDQMFPIVIGNETKCSALMRWTLIPLRPGKDAAPLCSTTFILGWSRLAHQTRGRPTVKSLVTMPNGRSSKLSAKASESCSRVGGISLARSASAPEMWVKL